MRDSMFYLANPHDELLRRQIYGAPHSRILTHFRAWTPMDGLIIDRAETKAAGLSMARFFGKTDYEWMRFGVQFPKTKAEALKTLASGSKLVH